MNEFPWSTLSDEELLELRICDLGVQIQGSELERAVGQLYEELGSRGVSFYPECYLGDEWFCPDGVPVISIPFYLAHPRLKQLEEKMMLEVEGGAYESCVRLLRHEAGHAINYAYRLHRRRRWKELFGDFSEEYPDTYRPRPYSKRFVRHLEEWYAQYHPDEDFAETFAVWLAPNSNWREIYQKWKALEKLEYVHVLMEELSGKPAKITTGSKLCEARHLRSKLRTYYERRRRASAHDLPGFYDRDLRRLFPEASGEEKGETVAGFLRRHQRDVLSSVARWTGESKFMINRLLKNLVERCRELDLRVHGGDAKVTAEIVAYLATLTMNYRATGRFVRIP